MMTLKGLILPCKEGALRQVANRPVIGHVLEELGAAGVGEVLVALPGEELRLCVEEQRPAGLEVSYLPWAAGAESKSLAGAVETLGEAACVVHAADGLLAQPLAPLAALLGDDSPDLVTLVHRSPAGAASIGLATRRLLRLAGSREDGPVEMAGVFLLGPGALREACAVRWCGERGLDLVPLAERLAEAGGAVRVERVRGWRQAGSSTAELLELNRMALDALCPPEAQGEEDNRIEGNVEVDPTACVQSSTIVGPAIVGAGALVLDSYIGPYTSIGAGARVEGAEVERSIVLEGASITHIGGRLVASVVGREARIYRDFSLPRALRVTVGDGDEVALC